MRPLLRLAAVPGAAVVTGLVVLISLSYLKSTYEPAADISNGGLHIITMEVATKQANTTTVHVGARGKKYFRAHCKNATSTPGHKFMELAPHGAVNKFSRPETNLSFWLVPLSNRDISAVEKFVFFVGWPRSGHSIIAKMMDAHPNMIIAPRLGLFRTEFEEADLYSDRISMYTLLCSRAAKKAKSYMVTKWQGRFDKLKVIGEKNDAIDYYHSPNEIYRSYDKLLQTVKVPIRVIFVVRNPYDMIATELLYAATGITACKVNASATNKYYHPKGLLKSARRTFEVAEGTQNMIRDFHLDVLELHAADHVKDPMGTMQKICDFLELKCSKDYLKKCYKKTYRVLSKSRETVVWTPEVLEMVRNNIGTFSFFQRYAFDKDY